MDAINLVRNAILSNKKSFAQFFEEQIDLDTHKLKYSYACEPNEKSEMVHTFDNVLSDSDRQVIADKLYVTLPYIDGVNYSEILKSVVLKIGGHVIDSYTNVVEKQLHYHLLNVIGNINKSGDTVSIPLGLFIDSIPFALLKYHQVIVSVVLNDPDNVFGGKISLNAAEQIKILSDHLPPSGEELFMHRCIPTYLHLDPCKEIVCNNGTFTVNMEIPTSKLHHLIYVHCNDPQRIKSIRLLSDDSKEITQQLEVDCFTLYTFCDVQNKEKSMCKLEVTVDSESKPIRLTIGELRHNVLCTMGGMACLKFVNATNPIGTTH